MDPRQQPAGMTKKGVMPDVLHRASIRSRVIPASSQRDSIVLFEEVVILRETKDLAKS
jgi:hypothetical protein